MCYAIIPIASRDLKADVLILVIEETALWTVSSFLKERRARVSLMKD